MKSQFAAVLREVDERLPFYFLVKGGRLHPIPEDRANYELLIQSGYEHIVDGVAYSELNKDIIRALNQLVNELGQRSLLLFPLAVSAIISHEAGREGSPLYTALRARPAQEATGQAQEDKKQKRKGK